MRRGQKPKNFNDCDLTVFLLSLNHIFHQQKCAVLNNLQSLPSYDSEFIHIFIVFCHVLNIHHMRNGDIVSKLFNIMIIYQHHAQMTVLLCIDVQTYLVAS